VQPARLGWPRTCALAFVLLYLTLAVLLPLLVPMRWASVIVHEAGHAFATKRFGRSVGAVGVGWYWFGPIAFVDTSDMWLAPRWPRIAVSLAGPYANALLGGLAALAAWFAPSVIAAAALWQFALASYLMVVINLNPLLEYDGYYVLADLLDCPDLRPRALAWLGSGLLPALRTPAGLSGHRVDLIYGVASMLYTAAMAVVMAVAYRLVLQDALAKALPEGAAQALAWVLASAVVGLTAIGVLGNLRTTHP
jgi:putative peptide zinc metalloprotease protein